MTYRPPIGTFVSTGIRADGPPRILTGYTKIGNKPLVVTHDGMEFIPAHIFPYTNFPIRLCHQEGLRKATVNWYNELLPWKTVYKDYKELFV